MRTTTSGRPVVLLNGLGATKSEELFYLWHHIRARLGASGIDPAAVEAGEFVTSFDMCGCSLTMGWLDAEALELWHDPVHTPAMQRGSTPTLQAVSNIAPSPPPPPARGSGTGISSTRSPPGARSRTAARIRSIAEDY